MQHSTEVQSWHYNVRVPPRIVEFKHWILSWELPFQLKLQFGFLVCVCVCVCVCSQSGNTFPTRHSETRTQRQYKNGSLALPRTAVGESATFDVLNKQADLGDTCRDTHGRTRRCCRLGGQVSISLSIFAGVSLSSQTNVNHLYCYWLLCVIVAVDIGQMVTRFVVDIIYL